MLPSSRLDASFIVVVSSLALPPPPPPLVEEEEEETPDCWRTPPHGGGGKHKDGSHGLLACLQPFGRTRSVHGLLACLQSFRKAEHGPVAIEMDGGITANDCLLKEKPTIVRVIFFV